MNSKATERPTVCVFSASSSDLDVAYFHDAERVGTLFGEAGWDMVFGGGTQGLMGHAARALHAAGGQVVGVIPARLDRPGVTYEEADELIVTETLRERKHEMDRRADAFVALPGGFGTLEEFAEVLALKQLQYHDRPVVLMNTRNFYAGLVDFFRHQVAEGFVRARYLDLFYLAETPEDAVAHVVNYAPSPVLDKYARD